MIDPQLLRNKLDYVCQQLNRKGFKLNKEKFLEMESRRKNFQLEKERLANERKEGSKIIGKLINEGRLEQANEAKAKISIITESLTQLESEFKIISRELDTLLKTIPNIPELEIPDGMDELNNSVISYFGKKPSFNFKILDHVTIGENLGLLDFDIAARLSGSRFVTMSGGLAKLHRALSQFMLDIHVSSHGYKEVYVPLIVDKSILEGTGQLPKFGDDLFEIVNCDGKYERYLIPTAEVPLTNLVRESILSAEDLPLKLTALTPCFRAEAGSYGRDVRGMFRQHQFDKVELVWITRPMDSSNSLEMLRSHAEEILRRLELHYRVVDLCGGDLGFAATRTYDLEVWLPGQKKYREISSCSNCTDFQARRMKARYRTAEGKPELVHTLNGSGLAVGRCLIAILENFQQSDGSINIPQALQPYFGNSVLSKARK